MRVRALTVLAFALAAAPAHAQDPVLVAAGDIACDPNDSSFGGGLGTMSPAPGKCHQEYTANTALAINPRHALVLGDIQYENGAAGKFAASYDPSWGVLKSITKPVPGNHEYGASGSDFDATAAGYFGYFQSELAAEGPDAGDPQKGWYSFDVPVGGTKWHIVALNSECASGLRVQVGWAGDCEVGSEQERWLRADLEADRSDCTLAYWHHPRFSSGGQQTAPIMAPIWNALYEDYADVVLAGHAHNYERLAQAGPTGAREPGRGIRSWVVGTGGKNTLPMQPNPLPATEVRNNTTHGLLKLTLHGPAPAHPRGWYEWQFVHDGQSGPTPFADSGSGDCVGPPEPVPPRVPGRVAVAPNIDAVAPLVSRARLSRRRFRVGRRGTFIRFTLTERSTVRFRVDRRRRGRYRRVGTFSRRLAAGRRRVKFTGRIGRRKLVAGSYRMTIVPTDAANNAGRARRLFFRILK